MCPPGAGWRYVGSPQCMLASGGFRGRHSPKVPNTQVGALYDPNTCVGAMATSTLSNAPSCLPCLPTQTPMKPTGADDVLSYFVN